MDTKTRSQWYNSLITNGPSINDVQSNLNKDLENVHQWFLSNKLTLNKEKTEYMIVCPRQRLAYVNGEYQIKNSQH